MANYSASDITTDEQSALDQVSEETSAAVKYDIAAKKAKDPATRDAMLHNKNDEIEHAGLMGKVAAEENPEVKEKMMDGVKEYDSIIKKSISECIKDRMRTRHSSMGADFSAILNAPGKPVEKTEPVVKARPGDSLLAYLWDQQKVAENVGLAANQRPKITGRGAATPSQREEWRQNSYNPMGFLLRQAFGLPAYIPNPDLVGPSEADLLFENQKNAEDLEDPEDREDQLAAINDTLDVEPKEDIPEPEPAQPAPLSIAPSAARLLDMIAKGYSKDQIPITSREESTPEDTLAAWKWRGPLGEQLINIARSINDPDLQKRLLGEKYPWANQFMGEYNMNDTKPLEEGFSYDWGTPPFSTFGIKTASLASRYNDAVRMMYTIDMLKKEAVKYAKTNPQLMDALETLGDNWVKYLRKISGTLGWAVAGNSGSMRDPDGKFDMRAYEMGDDVFSGFGDISAASRAEEFENLLSQSAEGTLFANNPQVLERIGQIVQDIENPMDRRDALSKFADEIVSAAGLTGKDASQVTKDAMKVLLGVERGAKQIVNRGDLLKAGKLTPSDLSSDERNYLINAAAKAGITTNDFWKMHEDGFDVEKMLDYYNYTRDKPKTAAGDDVLKMISEGTEFADEPEVVKAVAGLTSLPDEEAEAQMAQMAEKAVPAVDANGNAVNPKLLDIRRRNYMSRLNGLRSRLLTTDALKADAQATDELGPYRQWRYNADRINRVNKQNAISILEYLSDHPEKKISEQAIKGLQFTAAKGYTKDPSDPNSTNIFTDPEVRFILNEMESSNKDERGGRPRLSGIEEERDLERWEKEARKAIENDPYRNYAAPVPHNPADFMVKDRPKSTEEEFWEKLRTPEGRKAFMAQYPTKGQTALLGKPGDANRKEVRNVFGKKIGPKESEDAEKMYHLDDEINQPIIGLQFDPDLPIDEGVNKKIMDHLIATGQVTPGEYKDDLPISPLPGFEGERPSISSESVFDDYMNFYDEALTDKSVFEKLASNSGLEGDELEALSKKLSNMGNGFYGGLPEFLASDVGRRAMAAAYPGVFDPGMPLDQGPNAEALRGLIENGQFLNMKGEDEQKMLDFLLTNKNAEGEDEEQGEGSPGAHVNGALASKMLSGAYPSSVAERQLSGGLGDKASAHVGNLIRKYKDVEAQKNEIQALIDSGDVTPEEVEEYLADFDKQLTDVKNELTGLTAPFDSQYSTSDVYSMVNIADDSNPRANKLYGLSKKLEGTREYRDAKSDLSKKLLGNVPLAFLSQQVPVAYSPKYIEAATKGATFNPNTQKYTKEDGSEFDPRGGTTTIFDRMTKVYGGRDQFGRPIWNVPKKEDIQGISDNIDRFIEKVASTEEYRPDKSMLEPSSTASLDESIEYQKYKGDVNAGNRMTADELYDAMNEIFFNGLDIDNHAATLNKGLFVKVDGTLTDDPKEAVKPLEADDSHAGDADKFYNAFVSGQTATPAAPVPVAAGPAGTPSPGTPAEGKKVVVPVTRSKTECKCTRVRRRSDADPLPTDVGGLTMKDLTEPTIRDDAEGSSVKHMGESVIKKSTSELMRERMARRK